MTISRTLFTTAVATLVTALPGMHGIASAWVPPAGPRCSLVAVPDFAPEASDDAWIGFLSGGPLTASATTMTLTCSLQVGGTGVHTDPDTNTESAGPSANSVTLNPTLVSFVSPGLPVYVCTHVYQVDQSNVAADLYWDASSTSWSTSPATATCEVVVMPAAPVNGGILVYDLAGTFVATPFGVLADPQEWTCTIPAFNALVPYVVTCTPVNTSTPWTCPIVAVGSFSLSVGATLRTSVDCNGDNVFEAQTATVSGPFAIDVDWAAPGVAATSFSCRLDNGGNAGPVADYVGVCVDPGPPVR